MDEYTKNSITFYREEKRTSAQNLYQLIFAITAICSAILGYTSTSILKSADYRAVIFGSISTLIFAFTIIISLWRLFMKFRLDYLAASAGDKMERGHGANLTDEEKKAEKDYSKKTPHGVVKLTLWLFFLGVISILIAVLPLSLSNNADKETTHKQEQFHKNSNSGNLE